MEVNELEGCKWKHLGMYKTTPSPNGSINYQYLNWFAGRIAGLTLLVESKSGGPKGQRMDLYSTKIQQKPLTWEVQGKIYQLYTYYTIYIHIIWVLNLSYVLFSIYMRSLHGFLHVIMTAGRGAKIPMQTRADMGMHVWKPTVFSCKQNGLMWQPMVSWWLLIILPSTNRITLTYSSLQSELRYFLVTRAFCWPTTTWNANVPFWISVYCGANLVHDRNIQPIVRLWLILVVTPWRNHETCQTPPLCVLNDEQCYGMLYTYIVYVFFWYNQSNQLIVMIHQVSNFPQKKPSQMAMRFPTPDSGSHEAWYRCHVRKCPAWAGQPNGEAVVVWMSWVGGRAYSWEKLYPPED